MLDAHFKAEVLNRRVFWELAADLGYPADPAVFGMQQARKVIAYDPSRTDALAAISAYEKMLAR